jgi:hypothetical protein
MFFLGIERGSYSGVAKLKAKIQNYLWVGEDRPYRSRVAWDTCYLPKREGGLRLVDLANAMVALMSKWILTAMEPGDSNLKSLLRHRLAQYQLYSGGNWALNLQWFILKNHASKAGSKVWVQTARSWKQLVGGIWSVLIASFEEWLSASIWWDEGFSNISPLFSRLRAAPLSRQGLIHVRDAWLPEDNSFVSSGSAIWSATSRICDLGNTLPTITDARPTLLDSTECAPGKGGMARILRLPSGFHPSMGRLRPHNPHCEA